jgi:hypothetical protein
MGVACTAAGRQQSKAAGNARRPGLGMRFFMGNGWKKEEIWVAMCKRLQEKSRRNSAVEAQKKHWEYLHYCLKLNSKDRSSTLPHRLTLLHVASISMLFCIYVN